MLDRLGFQERFDCWNRDELDSMLEMYAQDAVFDVSAVFTDVAPVRGHDGMRTYWRELRETWGGLRLDPFEVLDVGRGRYVVDLRLSGEGRRSGVDVGQRFAFLYSFGREDGKVVRAELFPDLAAAIAAGETRAHGPAPAGPTRVDDRVVG